MGFPPPKSPKVVLQLPVDEDNYLAPMSATAQPAMYTDLSDKGTIFHPLLLVTFPLPSLDASHTLSSNHHSSNHHHHQQQQQ
jgi:hypothetical protein